MPEPAKKRASYEDLSSLPENVVGEIIDGELIVTPRPARRHIDAAASLGGELIPAYRFGRGGPGGWIIDPAARTLDIFRLESGKWLLLDTFAEDDRVRAEPFQEIEIELDKFWVAEF